MIQKENSEKKFVIENGVLQEYNDTVVIPRGVKKIGEYCFSSSSATKFIIPDTVEIIGSNAFEECTKIEEITIPDSVKVIGDYAFSGCSALKTIKFSENLKKIGEHAFEFCENIKSIILPDSVETVGDNAFDSIFYLEHIKLSKKLKKFGSCEFDDYKPFTLEIDDDSENFILENNILYTKDKTLAVCSGGDFLISNGALIKYLGDKTDIIVPKGVKTIKSAAFIETNVESITLPDDVEKLETSAFECATELKSVILSDNIKNIPSDTFCNCESLSYVKLPKSLETISLSAFTECPFPITLEIDPENKHFQTKDGILYFKNGKEIKFKKEW